MLKALLPDILRHAAFKPIGVIDLKRINNWLNKAKKPYISIRYIDVYYLVTGRLSIINANHPDEGLV
jgi:hypothetical protein